jgi:hypothetical protein
MSIEYYLNEHEYYAATIMAADRRKIARASRDKDSGAAKTSMDSEFMSVAAELAVCGTLGIYPTAMGGYEYGAPDGVCGDWMIEVRHTPYANGHLIVRPDQDKGKEDRLFILVTSDHPVGKFPRFFIHGCATGKKIMQPRYWIEAPSNGGNPYWQMSQGQLSPLSVPFNWLVEGAA